jgi:hypothetical protein
LHREIARLLAAQNAIEIWSGQEEQQGRTGDAPPLTRRRSVNSRDF